MEITTYPRIVLCLVVLAGVAAAEPKAKYPLPAALKDNSKQGLHIQRTMTLLATSTEKKHYKVRILFYGQSITEQDWSKQVAADLRKRFPHADLEIENRAIGGFASQLLIRPAEHDLYPYYPDLVIFHDYGSNKEYEEIIKNVRSRTTAEVLMQTDHVIRWPPKEINRDKDKGAWWDDLMNHRLLPEIAKKYNCGLVDIRGQWLAYLKDNHLEPKELLSDGAHLNDHGNFLMAQLVQRYLVHRRELPFDEWAKRVQDIPVRTHTEPEEGKCVVEFEGNRVDLIPSAEGENRAAPLRIRIDGKKPSELPGVYRITRPVPGPWSPLALVRVDHDKPLQREDWTLKITAVNEDSSKWEFEVRGAKTGADGRGSSDKPFTSKSGRVKIEPAAWFHPGKKSIPVGYTIRWQVLPTCLDTYAPPSITDTTRDHAVTIVQGIANTKHRLEIIREGKGNLPIEAVRVYRPPVK